MEIARSIAGVACSKEHQRIYAEWFALADPGKTFSAPDDTRGCLKLTVLAGGFVADRDGRVTGPDATSFFAMSGLSRADLKQVSG